MKLLDVTVNWSLSAITFSMSLLRVFRRTIGQKAFGWSYDDLFGLGMTIVVDTLNYLGQWPNSMQELAMLMILERQSSFAIIIFKWCHINLSGPSEDEFLHLLIADLNSCQENGFHPWVGLHITLLRMLELTWRKIAILKELWRAFHKLSGVRDGRLSNLIALVTGSFLFLTQFISSHGPRLLLAISWILSSKKVHLASLTVFLNAFQFSRFLAAL